MAPKTPDQMKKRSRTPKAPPTAAPDTKTAEVEALATPKTTLKLRDLIGQVAEVTGGNNKAVKDIVEATLAQLGTALAAGAELNLPGIGKVRVARTKDQGGRRMMTLKVRGSGPAKAKQPLADTKEGD